MNMEVDIDEDDLFEELQRNFDDAELIERLEIDTASLIKNTGLDAMIDAHGDGTVMDALLSRGNVNIVGYLNSESRLEVVWRFSSENPYRTLECVKTEAIVEVLKQRQNNGESIPILDAKPDEDTLTRELTERKNDAAFVRRVVRLLFDL